MEMFARDMVLTGPPMQVRAWAIGIAEAYGEATGRTPEVWASVVGGTAGHHSWTMPVDGSADVLALGMAAFADEVYLQRIEEGREFFTGPPRDTLYRPLNGTDYRESEPGQVCSVTTAVAEAGSLGHAVGWGLEVAAHLTTLTGEPIAFMGNGAGSFSRLTWLSVLDSARRADEVRRTIDADDEYLKLISRGGQFFVDGSARSQLFVRLG